MPDGNNFNIRRPYTFGRRLIFPFVNRLLARDYIIIITLSINYVACLAIRCLDGGK